ISLSPEHASKASVPAGWSHACLYALPAFRSSRNSDILARTFSLVNRFFKKFLTLRIQNQILQKWC
ncbi:MAG: hypothetical protein K2I07_09410, partial [Lachnospiraceae bacterium]|nr:hypothetical protein [Lachnospiraceae bacterium]